MPLGNRDQTRTKGTVTEKETKEKKRKRAKLELGEQNLQKSTGWLEAKLKEILQLEQKERR